MADNCYCSVQFKTGEELDEALLKAIAACDKAETAMATVNEFSTETWTFVLEDGSTVTKNVVLR